MVKNFRLGSSVFITGCITAAVMLSASCSNTADTAEDANDTVKVEQTTSKAQKILFALPSPMEMAILLKSGGANYDKDLLNPVDNTSKYSTNNKKALNLGVYGMDLAYTAIFNQTQETVFYMAATKKMADGLGITAAFTDNMAERMEANQNNNDSILSIISDAYYETDAFLKENDRAGASALMVAGGWIEGLYLATKVYEKAPKNDKLRQRIADEKVTLDNLVSLLESYPSDDFIKPVLDDMRKLKTSYDKLQMSTGEATASTDESSKVTTIGGEGQISMTDEQYKEIASAVQAIRAGFIKP